MRLWPAVLPFVLALFLPAHAAAVVWSPDCCGFSADFPDAPEFLMSNRISTDGQGNQVAGHEIDFICRADKTMLALVAVDLLDKTATFDAPSLLLAERDRFIHASGATLGASRAGDFEGAPALFFDIAYATGPPTRSRNMIVLRATPVPRLYIITTDYKPDATQDGIAALSRFYDSFHLKGEAGGATAPSR
jgi:hypothetical protein